MADPDFTFDPTEDPVRVRLVPLYSAILGSGPAPTVSLGAVTRDVAETWLRRQHDRYKEGLGNRSYLIKTMDLPARVDLVGLSDDGP